jgi:hypothetical protein
LTDSLASRGFILPFEKLFRGPLEVQIALLPAHKFFRVVLFPEDSQLFIIHRRKIVRFLSGAHKERSSRRDIRILLTRDTFCINRKAIELSSLALPLLLWHARFPHALD